MTLFRSFLVLVCFASHLQLFSQSFPEFTHLKEQGDSAYYAKNYGLSAVFYEEAMALPAAQRPLEDSRYYYDLACDYALDRDISKAIDNLGKGCAAINLDEEGTPYSYLLRALKDSDLTELRKTSGFKSFINKFCPPDKRKLYNEILSYDTLREISYDDLFVLVRLLSQVDKVQIVIQDKVIFWKKQGATYLYNSSQLSLPALECMKSAWVVFSRCTFKLNFIWNGVSNYQNGLQKIQPFVYRSLFFNSCAFEGRFYVDLVHFKGAPNFIDCQFRDLLFMHAIIEPAEGVNSDFEFRNCSVQSAYLRFSATGPMGCVVEHTTSAGNANFSLLGGNISSCTFANNVLHDNTVQLNLLEIGKLTVENNDLNRLDVVYTSVTNEFVLRHNKLNKLMFHETYFTNDPANKIDWSSIDKMRLGTSLSWSHPMSSDGDTGKLTDPVQEAEFISGANPLDISDDQKYEELIGLYSMFLNLYKNKNYLESYNQCYFATKELHSSRLHYLYESNKTFETYFRWRLSTLLKFYVRHGTDPARAIVISIYIVLFFGIFFFFFPSDWDVMSKKRMVENFRDFIQKNEKGYVKPFFILLAGFAISLVNAITLSLNAFITLGFGNIPTTGLARYVCVLEGFLGWFLLSIFTVALINQVLQ